MCLTFLLQVGDLVGHEVVEGVVATLKGLLVGETGLLEQVDHHVSSGQLSGGVEVDTDELSESGGVVVPHGLRVTPGLEDRVGLDDLVLKRGLSLLPLAGGANSRKIGNDFLGILGLPGARLASDQDGLVLTHIHHTLVRTLGYSKNMGWTLVPTLSHIYFHCPIGVDRESDVGIDGNAEQARVGIDELVLIPNNRVPQHAGIIEVSQACHVITAVKLRRVDLPHLVLFENFFLKIND